MARLKPMLTDFGIHQRLESCALISDSPVQLGDLDFSHFPWKFEPVGPPPTRQSEPVVAVLRCNNGRFDFCPGMVTSVVTFALFFVIPYPQVGRLWKKTRNNALVSMPCVSSVPADLASSNSSPPSFGEWWWHVWGGNPNFPHSLGVGSVCAHRGHDVHQTPGNTWTPHRRHIQGVILQTSGQAGKARPTQQGCP